MKQIIYTLCFIYCVGQINAQQASDYFPSQTGFKWEFKAVPLDSVSNPKSSLTYFRIDSFATIANYEGKLASIVLTKTGLLQTICLQPYLDSLFYHAEGTNGFEYFSIGSIEEFLLQLDLLGIDPDFNFVDFFTSLQDWYPVYQFASTINSEYTLKQVDTTLTINATNYPIKFKYLGKRLQDQTIPTVLGNFDCKKFLTQWKISTFLFTQEITLLTTNDTIWIAPENWIVQDIIPGQYVDNLTFFGVDPFTIPGLETKLTDEIVSVESNEITPISFILEQNYPNPFNPATSIQYSVGSRQFVSLKVYDVLGNEIVTLVNEEKSPGIFEVEFDARNLSSGIYFYRLQAGSLFETKKMLLLK